MLAPEVRMIAGLYATEHASAVDDVRAAGTAVTFTATVYGAYDPATDTKGTATTVTVSGYALRTKGNPIRYRELELTQSEAPTLLFAPATYGTLPALGASVVVGGRTYVVADVEPIAPDGVPILARVIVSGGGPLDLIAVGAWTLPAVTFAASGSLIFEGTGAFVAPAVTFDATGDNGVPIKYAPGDAGVTETRATTATYRDVGGVTQTAAINTLRDGHYVLNPVSGLFERSARLENARTNHFLQSGTPATQTSGSLATGTYTLWITGAGSVAVAGATATITGAGTATAGSPVTFTVTVAGTVTYTVVGGPSTVQAENGAFASAYIPTTTATVTRSADAASLALPSWFQTPQALTAYFKFIEQGTIQTAGARLFTLGVNATDALLVNVSGGKYQGYYDKAGTVSNATLAAAPAFGDQVEIRVTLSATGQLTVGQSINGAAETTATSGVSAGFGAGWSSNTLWLNSAAAGGQGFLALQSAKLARGVKTLAVMRTI